MYSPASGVDKCTLYSDRNLINRRNVKSDVDSAVNADRRFFELEVEARIVAAGMKELCISEFGESSSVLPEDHATWSKSEKRDFINNLSCTIVDKYILDGEKHKKIVKALDQLEERQLQKLRDTTIDGRYKCRFPGCTKTFKSDSKWRQSHELSHNPPVNIQEQPLLTEIHDNKSTEGSDDMYNYQKALLDYGMVILNFFDAISEGDGPRVIRNWKFMLLYLKSDKRSPKYALEGLYLMFQVYALLSPKASHELVWNRFAKRKNRPGGNIPLYLHLEFLNRIFKEAVKKLGPNASRKSINRICHAMGVTKQLTENFDASLSLYKRSGKHKRKSTQNDLKKVVGQLLHQQALTCIPGRVYQFYAGFKSTLLADFDLQEFYNWINDHKRYMILNRRAR